MKPRKLKSQFTSRAECAVVDGEKIVDMSVDLYDSRHSVREIRRLADWLNRAADWLEAEDEVTE